MAATGYYFPGKFCAVMKSTTSRNGRNRLNSIVQTPGKALRMLRDHTLTRDDKIAWMLLLLTALFIATTLFFYWKGMFLKQSFPFNTYLPAPENRFGDYWGVVHGWQVDHFRAAGLGMSYFPGLYLFADFFSRLSFSVSPAIDTVGLSLILFLVIFSVFVAGYCYANLKAGRITESATRVVICTFLSYPVLFTLHTGNFEAIVFMLLACFATLYQQKKYALSTLPLAWAIAMKAFPAVLLILFIADRKYRELLYALLGVAFFCLLPLLVYPGGILEGAGGYLSRLKASQKMYADVMVMVPSGMHFGHSLVNAVQLMMGNTFPDRTLFFKPYAAFALGFFAVVSAYIVLVERELWKKMTLLVSCMCLLPFTSTDYKLLHFYIPLFMFINSKEKGRFDGVYIVGLTLMLAPKFFLVIKGNGLMHEHTYIVPALMLLMTGMIMSTGLADGGWQRGIANARDLLTFKKAKT
jgi:hypothetical protein